MAKRLISIITTTLALLGGGQALAASSPPFVDNGNGTVTDTSTGLMWDQCIAGMSGNGTCTTGTALTYNWGAALGSVITQNAVNYKGYSDWRLPNVVEVLSLVKAGSYPTIDATAFPNPPSTFLWSASADTNNLSNAWLVSFTGGTAASSSRSLSLLVRLVRAGQYFGAFGVSDVTASAATLSATSAVAATGSWLVVPHNAPPPSVAQVIAGVSYGSVVVAAADSGAMTAKTPVTFRMSGLAGGTAYDVYLVAKESTYQTTPNSAWPIPFSTVAIATRSIVIDPATPAKLYAALEGSGVYRSSNSGANWSPATTQPSNLNVKALVIKPGTPATLFAASYGGGVFKSTDSGVNWNVACAAQPGNLNLLSLTIDAAGRLYAGSEAGVFVSSNDCGTWTAMNTGLPN